MPEQANSKPELKAPGEITHLGWQQIYVGSQRQGYFVEWRATDAQGRPHALQHYLQAEECGQGEDIGALVEQELMRVVNRMWREGKIRLRSERSQ